MPQDDRHPLRTGNDSQQSVSIESLHEFTQWLESRVRDTREEPRPDVPDGPNELEPADNLGRFEIICKVGRGGYGVVFEAFDPQIKRRIALKVPRPELLVDPNWTERTKREAQLAATLDHPGIVPIYEVGTIGLIPYIASAYCDGESLADWLARHPSGQASVAEAVRLVAQLAQALQHAHNRGILHRDLKPANILLAAPEDSDSDEGLFAHPRITDFGLAIRTDELAQGTSPKAGTPGYMAPELAASQDFASIQSDIYSLGAVLHELLLASLPSHESDEQGRLQLRLPEHGMRHDINRDLRAILKKALNANATDRYQTAGDFSRDLLAYLYQQPVAARPLGKVESFARFCRQRLVTTTISALVAAIVAGVVGGMWQWRRAERHLLVANQKHANAERSLHQAEQILLELGIAIDDNTFWREHTGAPRHPQVEAASQLYRSVLREQNQQRQSLPLLAVANGQLARQSEWNDDHEAAKSYYLDSLNQWWRLVQREPRNELYRRGLTQTCHWYGRFLLACEHCTTGPFYVSEGRLFDVVPLDHPIGFAAALSYAELLATKGEEFSKTTNLARAIDEFTACRGVCHELLARQPEDRLLAALFIRACQRTGEVTCSAGHRQEGKRYLIQAVEHTRALVERHPYETAVVISWGEICRAIASKPGILPDRERMALLQEATQTVTDILAEPNSEVRPLVRLAIQLQRALSKCLQSARRDNESLSVALTACSYCDQLLQLADSQPGDAILAAHVYHYAMDQLVGHDNDQALRLAEKAVQAFGAADAGRKTRRQSALLHSECHAMRAELLRERGQQSEAAEAMRSAIAVLEKWGTSRPGDNQVARQLSKFRGQLAVRENTDSP
jgi:serine/threonine protein kinase